MLTRVEAQLRHHVCMLEAINSIVGFNLELKPNANLGSAIGFNQAYSFNMSIVSAPMLWLAFASISKKKIMVQVKLTAHWVVVVLHSYNTDVMIF